MTVDSGGWAGALPLLQHTALTLLLCALHAFSPSVRRVYLVHPSQDTFGVLAAAGAGASLFPPLLGSAAAQRSLEAADAGAPQRPNPFTRCVFRVSAALHMRLQPNDT